MLTLRQSRSLFNKGVYEAARRCLAEYGGYNLDFHEEYSIRAGGSRVDDVVTTDGTNRVLCEAKSPSVMKKLGILLPLRGFELKWIPSESLVRRILGKVGTLFCVNYDAGFNKYVVRVASGSETDGMAVSYLP